MPKAMVEAIEQALHELLLAIEANARQRAPQPFEPPVDFADCKRHDPADPIVRDPVGHACRMAIAALGEPWPSCCPTSRPAARC